MASFFKHWAVRPTSGGHLLDDRAWTEYPIRGQDQPHNDTWRIEPTVGQERLPRGHAARATTVPPKVDEYDNSMSEATSAAVGTAMIVPQAYHGREQTYLKHRVLKHYPTAGPKNSPRVPDDTRSPCGISTASQGLGMRRRATIATPRSVSPYKP